MISGIIKFWGNSSAENPDDIKIHTYIFGSIPQTKVAG